MRYHSLVRRYPSNVVTTFGPGPITPAVRAIIIVNVAVYLATLIAPGAIVTFFGLSPAEVIGHGAVWQLATYLFVHSPSSVMHILFNMLAVWMFGVDLERRWGTRFFTKYYFVTGVGAGVLTVLVSLLPFDWARAAYPTVTIGASGAVYGLLIAWGLIFPDRQIYFIIFPMSARMFVVLAGVVAFVSAVGASGGPVANVAHLGGLLVGYLYLKPPRDIRLSLQYHLTRWRMERMRRRFDVHRGGRDRDWRDRIH
ncbi:MAG TPA: rhomboid family intramembrane serine protease [Vicinamibacterales bacterium]|jgi:membrane associated rhomboid family serine protease|nr:rhomboid family intramembrane serine protease [Vicinamibacterales bacterium]